MMPVPKISIITPVFNASETLKDCILSVANQNYPNLEHWFIDGLSTDNSLDIIKKYANKFTHIKYVSEKDRGIYDAMNKGIDLTTGEWLYFLGADDMLKKEIFNKIFSNKWVENFDVIYGNVLFKHSARIYDGKFDQQKMTICCICHQAIFSRKAVHAIHGKFELKYRVFADHVFQMKWFSDGRIRRTYVDKVFCIYNESGTSSRTPDPEFLKDRTRLLKKYYTINVSNQDDFYVLGKIGLDQIANHNIFKGLLNVWAAARHTGRFSYYAKNTAYYLRQRTKVLI